MDFRSAGCSKRCFFTSEEAGHKKPARLLDLTGLIILLDPTFGLRQIIY